MPRPITFLPDHELAAAKDAVVIERVEGDSVSAFDVRVTDGLNEHGELLPTDLKDALRIAHRLGDRPIRGVPRMLIG